jgi:hypothetical protein
MKTAIFLIMPLMSGIGLSAQNITTQTLRWNVATTQEINTGKHTESADQIVSYGNTRIEWQDPKGAVKKTFTITDINGSWTNVQSNGSVLYEVSIGEQQGTVTFIRTSGELTVRIILLKGEEDADLYEMSITDITTL